MDEPRRDASYEINLFRPKPGYMRDELRIIVVVLLGWAAATFGLLALLVLLGTPPDYASLLTRFRFFNLPFHFWFTGQFLPLWFVLLCVAFNWYIDRLTLRHSRRRERFLD